MVQHSRRGSLLAAHRGVLADERLTEALGRVEVHSAQVLGGEHGELGLDRPLAVDSTRESLDSATCRDALNLDANLNRTQALQQVVRAASDASPSRFWQYSTIL